MAKEEQGMSLEGKGLFARVSSLVLWMLGSIGLLSYSRSLWALGVVALGLTLLLWDRPVWSTALIVAYMPVHMILLGQLGPEGFAVLGGLKDVLLLVASVNWALHLYRRRETWRPRPEDYLFGGFLALGAVYSLVNPHKDAGIWALRILVEFSLPFIMGSLLPLTYRRWLLVPLLAVGGVMAVCGVGVFLNQEAVGYGWQFGFLKDHVVGRLTLWGNHTTPGSYGMFMTLVFSLALGFWLVALEAFDRKRLSVSLLTAILVLSELNILFTFSRKSWVAVIAIALSAGFVRLRWGVRATGLVVGVFVAYLAIDGSLGALANPDRALAPVEETVVSATELVGHPSSLTKRPEAPAESQEPVEGEAPAESQEPVEGEAPAESQEPVEGEAPAESQEPVEGEAPAESQEPVEAEGPVEAKEPIRAGEVLISRAFTVTSLTDTSNRGRLEEWNRILVIAAKRWFMGSGLGFADYAASAFGISGRPNGHSYFFLLLLEMGMVGLVLFGFLAYRVVYRSFVAIRKRPEVGAEEVALLLAVTGFLIQAAFSISIAVFPFAVYFWLYLGMLSQSAKVLTESGE